MSLDYVRGLDLGTDYQPLLCVGSNDAPDRGSDLYARGSTGCGQPQEGTPNGLECETVWTRD